LQSPPFDGAQRSGYGENVRHSWPLGQFEFEVHRQRPLTFAGDGLQLVVFSTLSQLKPPAQPVPHPPQWLSLFEMFTVLPPQHTSAAVLPHWCPFGRCVQSPWLPARSHALHAPAQSALQQNPSRQRFELHMPLRVHVPPFGFVATQLLFVLQ